MGRRYRAAARPVVRRCADRASTECDDGDAGPTRRATTRRSDPRSRHRRTIARSAVPYRRNVRPATDPSHGKRPIMTLLQNPPSLPGTTVAAASARGATKIYGTGDTEVLALDGVDVDFAAGQFTAIMGPSGSGKSTLMHCMAGLDRLDRRLGHHRRRRHHHRQREAAHPAAARSPGLHLPGVQPRADADRHREHHAADGPRRHGSPTGTGSTTWSRRSGCRTA